MTKFFTKLKKALLYCGLDRDNFNLDKEAFQQSNRRIVLCLSILMMLVFYVITVESIVDAGFSEGKSLFPVGAIAFTTTVIITLLDKQGKTTTLFSCLMRLLLYSYGLAQSLVFNKDSQTICLFVFLCGAPTLFISRPITIISEILFSNIVFFTFFAAANKPLNCQSDKSWMVLYSIGGICIGLMNLSQKIKNIDNARLLNVQSKHLELQAEEITAQATELHEAYTRAEQASKAKSIFLSNMSHEIRTPINAVLGLDEMIYRESNEENIRDYAYDLKSAGKTMLALINDLLDQSRLEAGKIDIIPVEYNIVDLLNDLSNMITVKAVEKGLTFKMDIDESLPKKLIGDELRIKQIITNILTNSIKYTEKGEVIFSVSYDKTDDKNIKLKVMVKDTGIGMKKEDIEKLFKPFERIEEKRNMNIEGTGLGMSITKNLLALMHTKLDVESVYGSGSTFSFVVDQEVSDFSPIGNYKDAAKSIKHESKRYQSSFIAPSANILAVDDTAMNLKVFKGLLKQTKINIDTADSGKTAIEMAKNKAYDIIFLDHMMPEMDGIETLRNMKEMNINSKFIAITANASSRSQQEYVSYGFDAYMAKPIEMNILEELLITYLPEDKVEQN